MVARSSRRLRGASRPGGRSRETLPPHLGRLHDARAHGVGHQARTLSARGVPRVRGAHRTVVAPGGGGPWLRPADAASHGASAARGVPRAHAGAVVARTADAVGEPSRMEAWRLVARAGGAASTDSPVNMDRCVLRPGAVPGLSRGAAGAEPGSCSRSGGGMRHGPAPPDRAARAAPVQRVHQRASLGRIAEARRGGLYPCHELRLCQSRSPEPVHVLCQTADSGSTQRASAGRGITPGTRGMRMRRHPGERLRHAGAEDRRPADDVRQSRTASVRAGLCEMSAESATDPAGPGPCAGSTCPSP